MTQPATARESLLELYDALSQRQLRDAGAEVASAIAHAVGTPLNVISGRAELIRHDPANALVQVARIEEQVKKLATGLRQIVDYLAVPEPSRSPASPTVALAASPLEVVEARRVLEDAAALARSAAESSGVELVVDGAALAGARVERWHALGMLSAIASAASRHRSSGEQAAAARAVRLGASVAAAAVVFEVSVPGLPAVQGWQLEHFHNRPADAEGAEFYRTVSICGAIVRGHGGKLQLEAAADGVGLVVRFSCQNEGAPAA